jgi:hypothetical protein
MVLQPSQARVCSGSRSLAASSHVAQIGVGTGLLAPRFAITPERASTLAADNADDESTGVANPRLRVVKDEP